MIFAVAIREAMRSEVRHLRCAQLLRGRHAGLSGRRHRPQDTRPLRARRSGRRLSVNRVGHNSSRLRPATQGAEAVAATRLRPRMPRRPPHPRTSGLGVWALSNMASMLSRVELTIGDYWQDQMRMAGVLRWPIECRNIFLEKFSSSEFFWRNLSFVVAETTARWREILTKDGSSPNSFVVEPPKLQILTKSL